MLTGLKIEMYAIRYKDFSSTEIQSMYPYFKVEGLKDYIKG